MANPRRDQSITIQIGNTSNYVGAHIWNLRVNNAQSNSLSSTYFRQNESDRASTPTPRVIIFDLNSNMNSLLSSTFEEYIVTESCFNVEKFTNSSTVTDFQKTLKNQNNVDILDNLFEER
jgi:hypothetical protein